jgi:lambda family phage portal protein
MDFIDKFKDLFSTNESKKRQLIRHKKEFLNEIRSFQGATKSDRYKYWELNNSSLNSDTRLGLDILRARSRDLVKNDGYSRRGIIAIESNTVGTGITAEIVENEKPHKQVQELWNNFTDSTDFDAEKMLTFSGMQALAIKEIAESGECFARKFPNKFENGKIPFELKLIRSELIDSNRDNTGIKDPSDSDIICQGIKFNERGKRLGFFVKNNINSLYSQSTLISTNEMLQIFRMENASQVRGIPWLSPVLLDVKDLSDYQHAELIRRKIASLYTAFVHDIDGSNPTDQGEDEEENQSIEMMPGLTVTLPAGRTVTLSKPPTVTGHEAFCASYLKKIACGLGVTYEVLSGDLSQVNFSSGRMGWLEFYRNIEMWRWNILIPLFCEPVFKWFLQSVNLYYRIDTKNIKVNWTPPKREMIDPLKEVQADILKIRNGFTSLDEIHREYGSNSPAVLQKIKHIFDELHKMEIILDCDPSKTTQNGSSNIGRNRKNDK